MASACHAALCLVNVSLRAHSEGGRLWVDEDAQNWVSGGPELYSPA